MWKHWKYVAIDRSQYLPKDFFMEKYPGCQFDELNEIVTVDGLEYSLDRITVEDLDIGDVFIYELLYEVPDEISHPPEVQDFARKFVEWMDTAPRKEYTIWAMRFGLMNKEQFDKFGVREIVTASELPMGLMPEIYKGMKLARYVDDVTKTK
jgi:hypothetical protein